MNIKLIVNDLKKLFWRILVKPFGIYIKITLAFIIIDMVLTILVAQFPNDASFLLESYNDIKVLFTETLLYIVKNLVELAIPISSIIVIGLIFGYIGFWIMKKFFIKL